MAHQEVLPQAPKSIDLVPILEKAITFLERGHTQGAYARNPGGNDRNWHSPEATCWCAMGAVHASIAALYPQWVASLGSLVVSATLTSEGREVNTRCLQLLDTVVSAKGWSGIFQFNDWPGCQGQEVVKVFREAMKVVKEHGFEHA